MKTILEARGLTASYPAGSSRRDVFRGLDLSVEPGVFLSILGPSGCGKTTLLKTLGGFHTPDAGSVLHSGRAVTRPGQTRIMIFQEFRQLFPWMTVLKNTAFPLKIAGAPRVTREQAAAEYLDRVGMSGYESAYPRELSGGMNQRTALARALVTRPDILLMDEPFASLDAPARKNLRGLLSDLWQELGLTIVFVTHDISEALSLSSRILLMTGGGTEEYPVNLPFPRDELSEDFKDLYSLLYRRISVS